MLELIFGLAFGIIAAYNLKLHRLAIEFDRPDFLCL